MSGLGPEWREVSYVEYRDDGVPPRRTATVRVGDEDPHYFIRDEPVPPLPTEPYTVIRATFEPDVGSDVAREFALRPDGDWTALDMDPGSVSDAAEMRVGITGFEVLASPANQAECVRRMEQVKRETAEAVLHEAEAFFDRAWIPGKMRVLSYDTQEALFARVRNRFGVES